MDANMPSSIIINGEMICPFLHPLANRMVRTSELHDLKRIKGGRRGPLHKYHYSWMIFIWAQFEVLVRIWQGHAINMVGT